MRHLCRVKTGHALSYIVVVTRPHWLQTNQNNGVF